VRKRAKPQPSPPPAAPTIGHHAAELDISERDPVFIPQPGSNQLLIVTHPYICLVTDQFYRLALGKIEPDWRLEWRQGWYASPPPDTQHPSGLVITKKGSVWWAPLPPRLGESKDIRQPDNIRAYLTTRYLEPRGLSWPTT
jgi:hypothetical protein